jgi:hypothetical protein
MSILKMNLPAETITQPIFILYGIPYMPSYVDKHRWIGPGREREAKVYTTVELLASGARLSTMDLWERSWTKEVKGWRIL